MYKGLALINGSLLAVMIFLNGRLSSQAGPYFSTFIFYIIGLLPVMILFAIKKNNIKNLIKLPGIFYLSGVLNVAVILLNNLCIPQIGVSLTIAASLYGQLLTSAMAEHFGLLGLPLNPFRKEKVLGFSLISLGMIAMILL